jgi:acylphosphatase
MTQDPDTRLHVIVDGRVQGVGFRYFVLEKANLLGVVGWVRNTYQGQVEVLAEGPREDLDLLLQFVERGPRSGFVSDIQIDWETATGEFNHFEVRQSI